MCKWQWKMIGWNFVRKWNRFNPSKCRQWFGLSAYNQSDLKHCHTLILIANRLILLFPTIVCDSFVSETNMATRRPKMLLPERNIIFGYVLTVFQFSCSIQLYTQGRIKHSSARSTCIYNDWHTHFGFIFILFIFY